MDRKRLNRIVCAILALVVLCLVCVRLWQNKKYKETCQAEMNALLVQIMTCIETNDVDQADRLAYGPDQMRQIFPLIANYWNARSTDPYEPSSLTFESTLFERRQRNGTIYSVYLVHSNGEDYQVIMNFRRDAEGEGIVSLNASRIQELLDIGVIPAALGHPLDGKTLGQWCFTLLWLLSCLFSLYTIYRILRRKPELYVLWILLSLVFFGVLIYRGASDVEINLRAGLFSPTKWTRYQNGVDCFQVCLPVGALLYWGLRLRRHLRRKKMRRPKGPRLTVPASDGAFTEPPEALAPPPSDPAPPVLAETSPIQQEEPASPDGEEAASPDSAETASSDHRHSSRHRHSSHHRHSSRHRHSSHHEDADASSGTGDASTAQNGDPSRASDYVISPRGDLPLPKRRHSSSSRSGSASSRQELTQTPGNETSAPAQELIPPLETEVILLPQDGETYTPRKHSSSRRRHSSRHRHSSSSYRSASAEDPRLDPSPADRIEEAPPEDETPPPQTEPAPPIQTEVTVTPLNGEAYTPKKHSSHHRHSSSHHEHSESFHEEHSSHHRHSYSSEHGHRSSSEHRHSSSSEHRHSSSSHHGHSSRHRHSSSHHRHSSSEENKES